MPPPQCNSGWEWNGGSSTCCPFSSPSQPAFPPKPSGKSGSGFHWPRDKKSRAAPLCPNSLMACPLPGLSGVVGDYECVDTYADLESCGGCASTGAGQDCTAIEGVWNVGCNQGRCASKYCSCRPVLMLVCSICRHYSLHLRAGLQAVRRWPIVHQALSIQTICRPNTGI